MARGGGGAVCWLGVGVGAQLHNAHGEIRLPSEVLSFMWVGLGEFSS
jgi:hypothetical protein